MDTSEKRVFIAKKEIKPITDKDKENLKTKFLKEIKSSVKGEIKKTDIIETENENCWALLFCDGIRIYRLIKYKKEFKEFDTSLFKEEKNIMKNFFLKFISTLTKNKVDKSEIIDSETETLYEIRYVVDTKEEFKIEFKKKQIIIE